MWYTLSRKVVQSLLVLGLNVVQLIVLRVEILCYFRYGAISPLQADSALSRKYLRICRYVKLFWLTERYVSGFYVTGRFCPITKISQNLPIRKIILTWSQWYFKWYCIKEYAYSTARFDQLVEHWNMNQVNRVWYLSSAGYFRCDWSWNSSYGH